MQCEGYLGANPTDTLLTAEDDGMFAEVSCTSGGPVDMYALQTFTAHPTQTATLKSLKSMHVMMDRCKARLRLLEYCLHTGASLHFLASFQLTLSSAAVKIDVATFPAAGR